MTPRKRRLGKKFLSTDQVDMAIFVMASKWRGAQRSIALIGGAAMQFYGSDRFTQDVDFIADDTAPADADSLDDISISGILTFGGKRYTLSGNIPVDVIVRSDGNKALYDEALDFAESTDENFLIVSPEYLVAMKFDAMRAKDEGDLLWLLAQKDLVNITKAEDIIRRFLGGDRATREFRQIVNEAKWRAAEGEFDPKI